MRHLAVLALSSAVVLIACSAANRANEFGSGGAGGSTASGLTTTGDGAAYGVGVGTGGGGPTQGCSPDLHNVVDSAGNVIQMCPSDQGCSGGTCVPACQAAANSKGNVGCDFVMSTPSFYVGIQPPCFATFVANNWSKDAKLSVTRDGQTYDVTSFARIATNDPDATTWQSVPSTGVPPGQVAVLFLSQDPNSVNGFSPLTCPVPTAVDGNNGTAVMGTGIGKAWHVTSDVPISAYDILPYGGASSYLPSAELLLPTSAWGDNFVAVLPMDSNAGSSNGTIGPPWSQIVASTDNTTIKIVPTVALPGGNGVTASVANQLATFTLNAGEYLQWQLAQDMTGSVIQADKPIAFTGGDGYICYQSATSMGGGCDSAHQMVPPVSALGYDYVAPPYHSRTADGSPESIPYRLVGAVDGTTLSYDPPVSGAPASLNAGQTVDFESTVAFRVKAQDKDHPFYVGQIMTGCFVTGADPFGGACEGDEEYVNILPPAQFLAKYVFFTDPTYPTTNLVFVRSKTASGFKDVNLDCTGTLTGWKPVGTSGDYEITDVDLVRDSVPNGSCANGPHEADSTGPFGIMVWGLSDFASYAYPAGGSVAPINTVVVPPTPK